MNINKKPQPAHVFLDFQEQVCVDILNFMGEKKIRMVYWDLGGTLVDISATTKEQIVKQINASCNSNISIILYDQAIRDEWKRRETPEALERIKAVKNDEAEREYWIEFFTCVLKRLRLQYKGAQLVKWLTKVQANPKSFEIYPYVQETLAKLEGMGIRVGIISNAFPSARKILKHTRLIQKIGDKQHIILSCEYNKIKPEESIYQKAIEKADVEPCEVLFIDDRRSFVEGAAQIGMEAVIITTEMVARKFPKSR